MLKQMGKLTYRRLSLALTIGLGLLTTAIKAPTTDQESTGLEDITSQERDPQAKTLAKLETEMQTLNASIARVEGMMQKTQTALQTLTQQSTQTGQAIATRMQTMRRPEASPSSTRIAIPPIPENLRGKPLDEIVKAASDLFPQNNATGSDDENNPTPQKPLSPEQLARKKEKLRQQRQQRSSKSPTPPAAPTNSPRSSSPETRVYPSPRSTSSSGSGTPRGDTRTRRGSSTRSQGLNSAIMLSPRASGDTPSTLTFNSLSRMPTNPQAGARRRRQSPFGGRQATSPTFTIKSDDTEADASSDDDTTSELPL